MMTNSDYVKILTNRIDQLTVAIFESRQYDPNFRAMTARRALYIADRKRLLEARRVLESVYVQ
jgi:hypothetical protein